MNATKSPYRFFDGVREGIPIGLGYLSISFGFGITAVSKGLSVLEVLMISMTNLTSAGQVAGVTVIVTAGTLFEMFLTQLVINLRYALMGISLTQRLDAGCTRARRAWMSFGLTDEIFALAASKPYAIGTAYYSGLMLAPYIGWSLGTLLGSMAGQLLPKELLLSLSLMVYAMFIAVMLPPAKKEKGVLFAVLLAAALSCGFSFLPLLKQVSESIAIILCAVISAAVMALLCPLPEQDEDEDVAEDQKNALREEHT